MIFESFGEEYRRYAARTKRLIPGIYCAACIAQCAAITKPGGKDSPKRLARSARATGTYDRSLATLEGERPAFCSLEAIFSRNDLGKSIFGSSTRRPARRKRF